MTPAEMDRELDQARNYLSCTNVTVDRCRHESVDTTSLWLFNANGLQFGSLSREDNVWRACHMAHGLPTSEQRFRTMLDGIGHILTRDKTMGN